MENNVKLIYENNDNLDLVQCKSINKRLRRELNFMYNLYDKIHVVFIEKSNETHIIVYEIVNGKQNSYTFIISKSYPFVCPSIFINNHKYIDLLINKHNYGTIPFKKISGFDCFCCQSLSCHNNWSYRTTLHDIISEIKHFKNIKRKLVLKLLLDKIKYKYLTNDVELESFIF